MDRRKKISGIFLEIGALIVSLLYIAPAWMVLVNSFKEKKEANQFGLGLPGTLHFENYLKVFQEGNIVRSFLNGMLIAGVSVLAVILIASLAAFYIARTKNKLGNAVYMYFISGMLIPVALIPTYIILLMFKLNNTYLGLILMFITYCIPVSIFLYTGFMKTIPREIDEASIMDGCNGAQLFYRIIFPLLKPVTVTVLIINFMGVWNDVNTQLFFASGDKWTMPMTIYRFYGMYLSDWNLVFANVVVTVLPVLIVYMFAQKQMIEGMTAGAVKG